MSCRPDPAATDPFGFSDVDGVSRMFENFAVLWMAPLRAWMELGVEATTPVTLRR